jgi:hypothetical protein
LNPLKLSAARIDEREAEGRASGQRNGRNAGLIPSLVPNLVELTLGRIGDRPWNWSRVILREIQAHGQKTGLGHDSGFDAVVNRGTEYESETILRESMALVRGNHTHIGKMVRNRKNDEMERRPSWPAQNRTE